MALEHHSIFDDEQYYDIYLRELQEAHFAVGASDLLRYQILTAEGGIYLDTDILPSLDIDKMINNNDEIKNESSIYRDDSLIINELVKLIIFNQLDDKNLQILKDKIDKTGIKTPDIGVWKKLSFALENLILENYIKEPKDVSEFLSCVVARDHSGKRSNGFIISNKKPFLLRDVQNRIKSSYQLVWKNEDEIIKKLVKKLISNTYILYKTGPGVFPETTWETDYMLSDICSFEVLNAVSTWINTNSEEFVSFEDLTAKYTLQHLLTESKPNIKQLQNFQKLNATKLNELTTKLNEGLKELDDAIQELVIFKENKDIIKIFGIERTIEMNTNWTNKIGQEIQILLETQKLISEKISLQDFDYIVPKINQNSENEDDDKKIAISINPKL